MTKYSDIHDERFDIPEPHGSIDVTLEYAGRAKPIPVPEGTEELEMPDASA